MYKIIASCISHRGKVREINEDNLYFDGKYQEEKHWGLEKAVTIHRDTGHLLTFGIFDGMGGEKDGEVASYLAASHFGQEISSLQEQKKYPRDFLGEILENLNLQVCEEARQREAQGMGTTATILCFQEEEMTVCNLGDSPAFLLRDGEMIPLHEEHTNRHFLEEQGITGKRPSLTQCLGIPPEEMEIHPYIHEDDLKEGDQYLICSDGLTDMVSREEITKTLQEPLTPGECVETLQEKALERGGKDNITIILCRVI
ncbi:MAG: PP2C family protein-serine/threonine phosphatase [Ruminococcus sp.]|jgi:serine/threonine protein phosphatase PrpC